MRVKGLTLILALQGNSAARIQPLSWPGWVFQEALPSPGDIFRLFFWQERGSQLHKHIHIHARSPHRTHLFIAPGLRGSCCVGLFVPSSSRSQSLDAYLNRLDLGESKTRFWFRPEVRRALGSLQKYLGIFSGETRAWLQMGLFLHVW